jgi:hypothetical protein
MVAAARWHGTVAEGDALIQAVRRNCECARSESMLGPPPPCSAHQLLADRHTLDRLLFARRIAWKLRMEELTEPASASPRVEAA